MNSAKIGGSWRTIKLPYARISNNWRPVKQIYTKVNGVWRITFDLNAADPFDIAGNLDKTPGNVLWEQVSGTWTKSGGNASGSTTSSIAAIETGTNDGEFEIDTASNSSGGPGVGFWITDQQTWWGVRYYTEQFFFTTPGTPFYYPYNCTYTFATRPAGNLNPAIPGTPGSSPTQICNVNISDSRTVLSGSCSVTLCPTCNNDSFFSINVGTSPCPASFTNVYGTGGGPTCACGCIENTFYSPGGFSPGTPGTSPTPATYNCPSITFAFGGNAFTFDTSTNYPLPSCTTTTTNAFFQISSASCTINPFGSGPVAGVNSPTITSSVFRRGQLVRSSSGAFSIVQSQDFGPVGNLYARTYGNSIDFRQYSGTGRTGTSSNIVSYATGGGSRGTKHGMIVTAVPFSQSYNIGRFKANL